MAQDHDPETTPVPEEPPSAEALTKLREQLASMKQQNQQWGIDLAQPSAGSKRVPAQLNPDSLVRHRLELLINFIMPEIDETEGIRLTFEIRFQKKLAQLHQDLEEKAVEEYKRQTKNELIVPGGSTPKLHRG